MTTPEDLEAALDEYDQALLNAAVHYLDHGDKSKPELQGMENKARTKLMAAFSEAMDHVIGENIEQFNQPCFNQKQLKQQAKLNVLVERDNNLLEAQRARKLEILKGGEK